MKTDSKTTIEQVILVQVYFDHEHDPETLAEFQALAQAAGACVVAQVTTTRARPDPHYFIGSGKTVEIRELVHSTQASLVLFNHDLAPRQERNLEKFLQCRILGRTGLVLDIFAQRARSFEGKLQVSLAQLQHLSSRLIRGWTHLERQQGGIGLRGPGETQLETDRRLIRQRIKVLKMRLNKLKQQRQQNRRTRCLAQTPLVSLVGYTNAGKSTLFNQLTGAATLVADQLFATLDPLLRRLRLPNEQTVVLADTVGFIRQLPHNLVEAFSATLEETREADVLLHVVDASNPQRLIQIQEVQKVLEKIGANHIPQLLIYNKSDQLYPSHSNFQVRCASPRNPHVQAVRSGCRELARLPENLTASGISTPPDASDETASLLHMPSIWVSAATGEGLSQLKEALMKQLSSPKMEDFKTEHFV